MIKCEISVTLKNLNLIVCRINASVTVTNIDPEFTIHAACYKSVGILIIQVVYDGLTIPDYLG